MGVFFVDWSRFTTHVIVWRYLTQTAWVLMLQTKHVTSYIRGLCQHQKTWKWVTQRKPKSIHQWTLLSKKPFLKSRQFQSILFSLKDLLLRGQLIKWPGILSSESVVKLPASLRQKKARESLRLHYYIAAHYIATQGTWPPDVAEITSVFLWRQVLIHPNLNVLRHSMPSRGTINYGVLFTHYYTLFLHLYISRLACVRFQFLWLLVSLSLSIFDKCKDLPFINLLRQVSFQGESWTVLYIFVYVGCLANFFRPLVIFDNTFLWNLSKTFFLFKTILNGGRGLYPNMIWSEMNQD